MPVIVILLRALSKASAPHLRPVGVEAIGDYGLKILIHELIESP